MTMSPIDDATPWTITALDTGSSTLDKSMLTYTSGFGELSADAKEGLAAFKEKRAPHWTGA